MASYATPALAAAVSNAGGLGSLGCGEYSPRQLARVVAELRAATGDPFNLGASGVQMGTAFLSCPEADISDVHRAAVANARDDDTRLSRAFSGRPARVKANRLTALMARYTGEYPEFPLMYTLSGPLIEAGAHSGDEDWNDLLYGQAAALNRALPAGELLEELVRHALALLSPDRRAE